MSLLSHNSSEAARKVTLLWGPPCAGKSTLVTEVVGLLTTNLGAAVVAPGTYDQLRNESNKWRRWRT